MQIVRKNNRKAISPVLATVILIAITLIAAIAIAGFVFGLFGTFTSNATVSAQVVNCDATGKLCAVSLHNTGSSGVSVTGCSIANVPGSLGAGNSTATLAAGTTATYMCTGTGTYIAGASAVGSFQLSNSGFSAFAGTWS